MVPEWDLVLVRMGVDGNPEYGKNNVYNDFLKAPGEAITGPAKSSVGASVPVIAR